MTAASSLDPRPANRAEQVEHLRRRMAEVSAKGVGRSRGRVCADDPAPDSESLLELPEILAGGLSGVLPRGVVAVLTGARSLPLSMVAAVTAAGGHAAIVGQPRAGLLAAAEMGADLSRVAVIPDPGADPVEVAAVLLDGLDLVVLDLGGRSVPGTRARAVTARARQKACTLLITGGDWPGAQARLDATVSSYEVTGAGGAGPVPGCGRIGRVRLVTRAHGRIPGLARAVGG
ncbi:MAG: hypothetical protein HYZ39_07030 [Mycolicibacterium cosmeticum]|nr:hypothetical protein [Mycolicibacterium cosmeticum]